VYFFARAEKVIFILKIDIFTGNSNCHTTNNKALVTAKNKGII